MRAWPSLVKDISIKISGLGFHSKNRKNRDVSSEVTCGPSLKIFTLQDIPEFIQGIVYEEAIQENKT